MHYCHRLAPIFGHMYANMYLTPKGSQTAPPHTDDRDVIIVQVQAGLVCLSALCRCAVQVFGHKHWKLWNNPQPLCYKEEQLGKGQPKLM
jgi:ribosomal protein L16 Arg81 hydroxylase